MARGGSIQIRVSFREGDVQRLLAKLGPELVREAIGHALRAMALLGEAEVKRRLPAPGGQPPVPLGPTGKPRWVRTGHLRRSVASDVRHALRLTNPSVRVGTDVPYARWVETGRDSRGRRMRIMPGGYRAFEQAGEFVDRQAGTLLRRSAEMIERKWAS